MLRIILLLILIYIIYLVFFKNKDESTETKEEKEERLKTERAEKERTEKQKMIDLKTEKFVDIEEKHYGSGLMIPIPAYKADTTREESFLFNIHKKIKNSKTNNIYQLYQELTNDNYSLFNNLKKLQPNEASNRKLYQNLYYDPKTERKYLFSTGLPKVDDLVEVDVYDPVDADYLISSKENKSKKENKNKRKINKF